ncbi:MAG: hypothetical protein AAB503_02825 [Patescibacteria group bacterium]
MMVCCALPLVLVFVFSAGGKALGASPWIIFSGITAMVIVHFFTMGGSRKHPDGEKHETIDSGSKNKDSKDDSPQAGGHSKHGCCH